MEILDNINSFQSCYIENNKEFEGEIWEITEIWEEFECSQKRSQKIKIK